MKDDIENVLKLNAEDGDMLVVTLAENDLPTHHLKTHMNEINKQFSMLLKDKDVKIIVIPHGMKVEILSASILKDKI